MSRTKGFEAGDLLKGEVPAPEVAQLEGAEALSLQEAQEKVDKFVEKLIRHQLRVPDERKVQLRPLATVGRPEAWKEATSKETVSLQYTLNPGTQDIDWQTAQTAVPSMEARHSTPNGMTTTYHGAVESIIKEQGSGWTPAGLEFAEWAMRNIASLHLGTGQGLLLLPGSYVHVGSEWRDRIPALEWESRDTRDSQQMTLSPTLLFADTIAPTGLNIQVLMVKHP